MGGRKLIGRLSQTVGWVDGPAGDSTGGSSFILEAKLFSKEINFYKVCFLEMNKNNKYECLQRGKPHVTALSIQGTSNICILHKHSPSLGLGVNTGAITAPLPNSYFNS